ncbi:MAG: HAMP domain-containing sensor histidine kinase [Clostridia bacterium]|nr:HAMP domain-containing sensor histidine kinase [Clostridia bacterium]
MFKSVFSRMFWNDVIIVFTALATMICTLVVLFSDYVNDRQFENDMKAAKNIQFMTIYLEIKNPDYRNYYIYNNFLKQYSEFIEADIIVVNAAGSVHAATNSVARVPADMNDKVLSGKTIRVNSTFGGAYQKNVFVVGVPIMYNDNIVGGIYFNTQIPNLRGRLRDYYVLLLFPAIISIIIGCIISYIKSKKITSPLKEINKGVLELASGNFSKRISVNNDELGQLASSFNYMADSLERLDGLRTRFVSDVSHELRTPMTSISGFVAGILDGTIPPEKEKEYLQIVYDESVRLTKLTNDMLEMTKMQSAEYKLDISEFDINELVRICIIQLEQKIESKNLELEVDFEPEKINVLADKDAIKRVIINIIENAVKFSYENTKIIIKTEIQDKKVNVSVGNFGAGISEDEMKNIFDRFYKTDKSRSEDKKGAGLGLSLAKNIMNLHKQKIWVESFVAKEGSNVKFTRFTFTLKLA